jgi:hypothetical protein
VFALAVALGLTMTALIASVLQLAQERREDPLEVEEDSTKAVSP